MPGSRARRAGVAILMSAAGLALLWWQIQKAEPGKIRSGFEAVGIVGFAGILALSLLRFTLRSLAWRTLIGGGVSLAETLRASIAGDALGNLTIFGLLASEPAKAMYLKNVATTRALAALTAENFFYTLSVGMVIVTGTITMLATFELSPTMQWISLGLVVGAAAGVAGVLWVIWRQPSLATSVLSRVPFISGRAIVGRLHDFETTTYSFVRQRPDRLMVVLLCEAGFHLVSWLEACFTLSLITGRWLPVEAFVLDTVNRIINVIFKNVPLRLGFDQYSAGRFAELIGLTEAAGLTMSLVRTVRLLVWAAIGLALLSTRAAQRPRS